MVCFHNALTRKTRVCMTSKKKTGVINVIQSVLSAAFGVQKRKNLERDFTEGKPAHFIIAGLIATILFIFLLFGLVILITNIVA